ncbi:hypothetical protein [Aquibium sp. ELW1220]|uniref:hypothetical protein n=1 Tax=Aquibium sp. ELW1220 TaxID=2976766 RepID=UPI0025B1BEA2|nr:hypothetical protein [Aquibium sp. ELW1220]MDN2583802.1 hypothetical protein [Aquibium sp. ELW1220]
MKTFVEFRSKKFPRFDGEEEQINPGVWGLRLAEYMDSKLEGRGIATHGILSEDWGYYIPLQGDGAGVALCCGHQYGDDDQFIIFTDPKIPRFRKLFRIVDVTRQMSELLDAVRAILESDPDIRDIKWLDQ